MASGTDRRPGHLGTGAETPPPAPSVVPPDRRVVARRYELGRELGAGSYGRVWFARDLVGQRDVALKRLRSDQAGDAIVRRRLWREARAVARLEHPAIVRLFDYGEDESREPYVVMELVDGESLARAAARCNSARCTGARPGALRVRMRACGCASGCSSDGVPRGILRHRAEPSQVDL